MPMDYLAFQTELEYLIWSNYLKFKARTDSDKFSNSEMIDKLVILEEK